MVCFSSHISCPLLDLTIKAVFSIANLNYAYSNKFFYLAIWDCGIIAVKKQ